MGPKFETSRKPAGTTGRTLAFVLAKLDDRSLDRLIADAINHAQHSDTETERYSWLNISGTIRLEKRRRATR